MFCYISFMEEEQSKDKPSDKTETITNIIFIAILFGLVVFGLYIFYLVKYAADVLWAMECQALARDSIKMRKILDTHLLELSWINENFYFESDTNGITLVTLVR